MSENFEQIFQGKIKVSASVFPYVSYLHYHNQLEVISDLNFMSVDGGTHDNIRIEVKLYSGEALFADPFSLDLEDISSASREEVIDLNLRPSMFAAMGANQRAEVSFELFHLEESMGEGRVSVELFPLNTWSLWGGLGKSTLLLGSFSQPGDKAIPQIIAKSREIKSSMLSPNGGTYGLDTVGYQSGPDSVLAETQALYEAIQTLQLEYSNPFPNFNIPSGQHIRTVSEIVADKSATCLDTAMMMSSCLSYMGLHPLVVLVPGHAYVGVHLYEGLLENPVMSLQDINGLVVAGRIALFETTTLCSSTNVESFASSQALVSKYLDPNFNPLRPDQDSRLDVRVVLDVVLAQSRYNVKPLPSVSVDASGEVTVVQTELPKVEFNFTGTTASPRISLRDDASPERVKVWKASLLDMTFNNPLLNRDRRVSAKVGVPKGKLGQIEDFLQQPNSFFGIKALETSEGPIPLSVFRELPESIDKELNAILVTQKALAVSATQAGLNALLKKLMSSSKASVQETGVNNLYMTFGSLTWDKDPNKPSEGQVTSPLFLLPVTIKALGKNNYTLQLDDTEDATPNETLALALSKLDINIPVLSNPESDEAGFDIPGLIAQVREQINVVHKKENWIVAEDATIGTFDFSNFHMWKDLNNNWKQMSEVPLVSHLIETDGTKPFTEVELETAEATVSELDSEIEKLPIPSDEAQVKAILKSLSGQSFIIQGPPGTGKSQTITNLLARNLQEGKKVLFMSEKAAALAVVKTRLDAIGLGPFVLDLHDKGTKPSSIRNQLLEALDADPEVDKTARDAASTTFETALRTLASYPDKLHLIDAKHEESIYSSRDRMLAVPGTDSLSLTREVLGHFEAEARREFLAKLRDLPEVGRSAGTYATNSWSFSTAPQSALSLDVKESLKSLIKKISGLIQNLSSQSASIDLLKSIPTFSDLELFSDFDEGFMPSASDVGLARTAEGSVSRHELKTVLAKLIAATSEMANYQDKLSELNVEEFDADLNAALASKFLKKRKLDKLAQKLNVHLVSQVTGEKLAHVFKEIKVVLTLASKTATLSDKTIGLGNTSEFNLYTKSGLTELDSRIKKLEALIEATDEQSKKNASLVLDSLNQAGQFALLGKLAAEVSALFSSLEVTGESSLGWQGAEAFGQKLVNSMPKLSDDCSTGDLRQLTRWSLVLDLVRPLMSTGQSQAAVEILDGKVSYDNAANAFERSFLSLLFVKLLDDQDLHNFDGIEHDAKIDQFDKALITLRRHNQEVIATKVVGGRKFDARASVGVSGALRAELSKARAQMPVRKLINRYWDTITQIAPIVAASPDSVARFLDIDTAKFDLVVFDEASQIRVATAIGALGRAKQAIVVGDSKQMPPTSLFKKADGSGEAEYSDEDAYGLNDQESILTMATVSQIPSVMLTWHYRSQDEILIAFSNKEIYEGKLSSFPSPRFANQPLTERKLRFDYAEDLYISSGKRAAKGEGEYSRPNTNLGEAKRIVKEIQKYVKNTPVGKTSLGVITMNEQQRQLIEDLLDDVADAKLVKARNYEEYPENYIFVRALERVQGDERDVILFSLGFAPEVAGGRLNLNFGPLIRSGSERRLNVAITRSRKEMIVFGSFLPSAMAVAETASKGMHLLKKFLEFAHQGNIDLRTSSRAVAEDRHRSDIAKALSDTGLKVVERLGMSNFRVDIAIADPRDETKCIMAIMLDGRGWLDRKTSPDREILPRTVLKSNMGWPAVERVWLPMWLRDPQNEVKRIQTAVDQAIARSETIAVKLEELKDSGSETDDLDFTRLEEAPVLPETRVSTVTTPIKTTGLGVNIDEVPYFTELQDRVVVSDKRYIQHLYNDQVAGILEQLITQLTETEGPVSSKRAVSFVVKCFGMKSVQAARQQEILDAISTSTFKRDDEDFIYPAGSSPKKYTKWAKQEDSIQRSLADISLVEIANAMATLCSKTHGMESAELAKQTALAFGNSRLTSQGEIRMYEAEELGLKLGKLRQEGSITHKA